MIVVLITFCAKHLVSRSIVKKREKAENFK